MQKGQSEMVVFFVWRKIKLKSAKAVLEHRTLIAIVTREEITVASLFSMFIN